MQSDIDPPVKNVFTKMVKGSLWVAGARAVTNALSFISTIVLARLLMPADFGLVAIGTTTLAIITAMTDISLAQALVHHRAPTDSHLHTAWTLNTLRGVALSLIMVAIAWPMAVLYHDIRLRNVIYALAFATFLSGMANPRRVMLTKQLVFWQDFLLLVSQRLVLVIVSITIAVIYHSYWALIIGVIAGQVASDLISYMSVPFLPRFSIRHFRELWSFSIWLTLGQAISTINWRFDQLLVGGFLGKAALGFYSVGDNLAQMPSREATEPLTRTLFPAFSRISHDLPRLRQGYQRSQALVTAIALPVGCGVSLIAAPLVITTMGAKWLSAVPVIQILSSVFGITTLGTLVQPLAMARGATKLLFKRDMLVFAARIPIIILGMYVAGLIGLIYARVFTGLFAMALNILFVRSLIGLSVYDQIKANVRSLSAVASMVLGVLVLQFFTAHYFAKTSAITEIATTIAVAGTIYLGMTYTLWRVSGQPLGPEVEVAGLLTRLRRKAA